MSDYWIIIISLIISAFFSGMEIAFLSSNKLRFELDRQRQSLTYPLLSVFFKNPEQFIATLLVGNNIALVVYGMQMADLLSPFISLINPNDLFVTVCQTLIATAIVLITGEFLPKTIFKNNPNLWLKAFSPLLYLFYILLYPIARFSTSVSILLLKAFKVKLNNKTEQYAWSKVDLDYLITETFEHSDNQNSIENEVRIFQNALDFSSLKLRDCIVPRTEIMALDEKETNLDVLKNSFVETGYSKILIYKENIDNIIGYFHSSDLFKNPKNWKDCLRKMPIVPETMAANKLMNIFMQEKKSIAVVVDEFGGTSGIVTLEDIMEEIFGEIEDEHDNRDYVAKQTDEKEYVLSGRLEIKQANELLHLDFPEQDDYATVAGLILFHYQKFPQLHETIHIEKWQFKILKAHNNRIDLVKVTVEK